MKRGPWEQSKKTLAMFQHTVCTQSRLVPVPFLGHRKGAHRFHFTLGCRCGRRGTRSGVALRPAEHLHFILCLPCRLRLTCINLQNVEVKNLSLATLPLLRHSYFLPLRCKIRCSSSLDRRHTHVFWACSWVFQQKQTSSHLPLAPWCKSHHFFPFGKNQFLICRMGTLFTLCCEVQII